MSELSDDLPEHLGRVAVEARGAAAVRGNTIEAREGTPGHPQTDPRILVSLWLYATLDGIGSARELERLCEPHAAYRWLCGGVSINHHTLSDFRTHLPGWLIEVPSAMRSTKPYFNAYGATPHRR
jgi:hypothetical protein